jgi:hypothetical protein
MKQTTQRMFSGFDLETLYKRDTWNTRNSAGDKIYLSRTYFKKGGG